MKRLAYILAVIFALVVFGVEAQNTTNYVSATNSSGTKLSVIPTTSAFWRVILPTEDLNDALWAMGLTNMGGIIVETNSQGATNPIIITTSNITSTILSILSTNASFDDTAVQDGYILQPTAQGQPSNTYVFDGGLTNSAGQKLIAGTITPTNDVLFSGVIRFKTNTLHSIHLFANADRKVMFPTNLFVSTNNANLLTTNDGVHGMIYANGLWNLVVSNGHMLTFAVRSNLNGLEPMWRVTPSP